MTRQGRFEKKAELETRRLAQIARACPVVDEPLPRTREERISFFVRFLCAYGYNPKVRGACVEYPQSFETNVLDLQSRPYSVWLGEKEWLKDMSEHITRVRQRGPAGLTSEKIHFQDRVIMPVGRMMLERLLGHNWPIRLKTWIDASHALHPNFWENPVYKDGAVIDPQHPEITVQILNARIVVEYDNGSAWYQPGNITLPPMPVTAADGLAGKGVATIIDGLPDNDIVIRKALLRGKARKTKLMLSEEWENVPRPRRPSHKPHKDQAMPQFTFDTTIETEDDSIDVTVVYDITKRIPARLYGDHPQPAEGGDVEIVSIKPYGASKDDPELEVNDKQLQALHDEAVERGDEDFIDEAAAEGDYRYDKMREERMLENWDA